MQLLAIPVRTSIHMLAGSRQSHTWLLCRDPVAALVLCTPSIGFVDLSVINGEVIVRDGKFTTIELQVRPQSFCPHCLAAIGAVNAMPHCQLVAMIPQPGC